MPGNPDGNRGKQNSNRRPELNLDQVQGIDREQWRTELDWDQNQGITRSKIRLYPDQIQWITGRRRTELDPDQLQGITGRKAENASSTRTKSNGSLGAHRQKSPEKAMLHLRARMLRTEHPCRCVKGQTHRIKTPYRSTQTSPLRMPYECVTYGQGPRVTQTEKNAHPLFFSVGRAERSSSSKSRTEATATCGAAGTEF